MFRKMFKTITIVTFILWLGGYLAFVVNITSKANDNAVKADAIIVLTGGNNRVQTGLQLWQRGISENLFITGVHKSVTKNDILRQWQKSSDLPECCMTLGHDATTTRGNAIEARQWTQSNNIKNIVLVTSNYHMDRALLEFSNSMPDIKISTNIVVEGNNQLRTYHFWKTSFIEYHKTIFRYLVINLPNKLAHELN